MKNPFAQLTSLERRFLAVAGLGVFIVANYLVVWPRFSEWSKTTARLQLAEKNLKMFTDEIAQKATYEARLQSLSSEGVAVPPEDQSTEFLHAVQSQAAQSGVSIISSSRLPPPAHTNQFFLEQLQAVRVQANESQLVDFLYKLGAGNSLIRVRELSLQPDAPRLGLAANIKLVASYQKKTAARPAPAAAAPATNTVKTATPTVKKP